jgi:hypothetical protein
MALALSPIAAAGEPDAAPVDFERHVTGVFGRMGCNAGSCHGSFQGRGGMRLSLFGYDPAMDHEALTRDGLARRVNPLDPDRSLILLKATAQVPHAGGRRFEKGSWAYGVLRSWIAAGARRVEGSGEVAGLAMDPPEHRFDGPGGAIAVRVRARFEGGDEEDVTRFCDFRIQDDAVAEVDPEGNVRSLRPGDTALIVSYRGHVGTARVLVPAELPGGSDYPEPAAGGYIDREVAAKLRRLNIVPSGPASDAEFLRRVTIDTIGTLPAPDDVRAFLADTDPDKRARKIDELLAHPLHAALWATKLSDVTGNNTDALEIPGDKHSQMWHDWLRARVAANQPYDALVRDILRATSRDGSGPEEWLEGIRELEEEATAGYDTEYADRETLDLFWRRQARNTPIEQWGEKVAAAFLGIRLECAQCHKHPFDRWTQEEYRAFANVFGQVAQGASPEAKTLLAEENKVRSEKVKKREKVTFRRIDEVYLADRPRSLRHPATNKPLPAQALGGPEIPVRRGEDARAALADWLTSPENSYFARSFVNRVWGHYLGVGIVDPVDDFAVGNPPSNPALLDALAGDFAARGFDLRHLERTILNSQTYQRSSDVNPTNRFDSRNYSHALVRPLMAEAVVDVLGDALGVRDDFGRVARRGSRAIEIGASRVGNGDLAYAFRIFGRPPRSVACDCERAADPALPQALYLIGDRSVVGKIDPKRGRLKALLASDRTDDEILDELFLATLSRLPTDEDRSLFHDYRASHADRGQAFADTLWALVNTREFVLNH